MTIIPAKTGRAYWRASSTRGGSFTPNGQLQFYPNRESWTSEEPLWAARLFVGLSVGAKPRWKVDDVLHIVEDVRTEQTGTPDSSFLTQRGLYKSRESGEVVEEDAVQVVILNTPDLGYSGSAFRKQMIALAEALVGQLKQEEVIVELQRGGLVQETIGVVRD